MSKQNDITDRMRGILIDWLIEVGIHYTQQFTYTSFLSHQMQNEGVITNVVIFMKTIGSL